MKNKQEVDIIILPTENINETGIVNTMGNFFYITNPVAKASGFKGYHLYFTSDSGDIIEGDVVSHFNGLKRLVGKYIKHSKVYNETNCVAISPRTKVKKVIATTDTSLGLPLIDSQFIQKYVKANGGIDKVWIEMYENTIFQGTYAEKDYWTPKLNNGYVIITNEKLYTREELIFFLDKRAESIRRFKDDNLPAKEWLFDTEQNM